MKLKPQIWGSWQRSPKCSNEIKSTTLSHAAQLIDASWKRRARVVVCVCVNEFELLCNLSPTALQNQMCDITIHNDDGLRQSGNRHRRHFSEITERRLSEMNLQCDKTTKTHIHTHKKKYRPISWRRNVVAAQIFSSFSICSSVFAIFSLFIFCRKERNSLVFLV